MTDSIEPILLKQIEAGNGLSGDFGGYTIYQITEDDFCITNNYISNMLIDKGYKKQSLNEFTKKVKSIFNLNIDKSELKHFDISSICDTLDANSIYMVDEGMNSIVFHIDKKNQIITNTRFLPELIDYKNLYPKIAHIEDSIPQNPREYKDMVFTRWKDIKDLDKERIFNWNILLHRNKYLFNDSKASLTWLKLNDTYFLESLVKTFGYVEDKDLLQWVVSETFSNKNNKSEDYNSLFFMKNCSNQFVFHKATFDLLQEKVDNKSLEALKTYIDYRAENEELQNLSFEQKAKVLAHVLYIGEYFAHQEQFGSEFLFQFMGTFYEYDSQRDKYDEEFKKNNYYNLFNFEKLWKTAKEEGDGIGLPM